MTTRTDQERDETFAVADSHLIRSVIPAPGRGNPYEHRCPYRSFEEIAHAADELGEAGFTLDELAEAAGTTNTQARKAVAVVELKADPVSTIDGRTKFVTLLRLQQRVEEILAQKK